MVNNCYFNFSGEITDRQLNNINDISEILYFTSNDCFLSLSLSLSLPLSLSLFLLTVVNPKTIENGDKLRKDKTETTIHKVHLIYSIDIDILEHHNNHTIF